MTEPILIDQLLTETNARFERLRHPRSGETGLAPCQAASRDAAAYITDFWPALDRIVEADPRRLGLSAVLGGERVDLERIRQSVLRGIEQAEDAATYRHVASVLAPLLMMTEVMNHATGQWADELIAGRRPLPFEVDADRYVSLRALLGRGSPPTGPIGPNAPTLVMGGTTTALTLGWNLLLQIPRAAIELTGTRPDRVAVERVWRDTRELLFRTGSGSLVAFVALASALAPDTSAKLWDGGAELGLVDHDGRFRWTLSPGLAAAYHDRLAEVIAAQDGVYVGCAALHARTRPLALDPAFSDPPDNDAPTVFGELLRWMTAVARAEYFGQFEASVSGADHAGEQR